MRLLAPALFLTTATVALLLTAACTSNSGGGGTGGTGGGPVQGTADTHCSGMAPQPTSQASCHVMAPPDAGTEMGSTYGPTMYDSEGDDDDCKYHVKWSSTPIGENRDVTFTVVATTKVDGKPLGSSTGAGADANLQAEVYLDDKHPGPPTNQVATETAPGTYTIGPVRFDAAGQWTVRFHFYENCTDYASDSPHGHVAFFVQVP
jgi:hypothetical protein